MTEVHSHVGAVRSINDEAYVCTQRGETGYALFGPYVDFAPGSYVVTFEFLNPERDARWHGVVRHLREGIAAFVEVACDAGRIILAKSAVSSVRLSVAKRTSIDLHFTIDRRRNLEFRVYATGGAAVVVGCDRKVSVLSGLGPIPPPELARQGQEHDEVFEAHVGSFRMLYNLGAEIVPSKSGTLVNHWGVKFVVRHAEDFQLIDEIFIGNAYNFASVPAVAVIDIGMNIGLASLYFASRASVKAVHSFEPYPAPFARAIENFDLNPELKKKVRPHNFGIGGKTETLDVLCNPAGTVAKSVRGDAEGQTQRILVREAGDVFAEIIRQAESEGLAVVVKMDCEGSEFPIFENLAAHGSLKEFEFLWSSGINGGRSTNPRTIWSAIFSQADSTFLIRRTVSIPTPE